MGKRKKKQEKKAKANAFDVDDWLDQPSPNLRARCLTCHNHPDLADDIRAYLQARAGIHPSGKQTKRSPQDFYDTLLVPQGYELTFSAFYNHLRNCERELWTLINKPRSDDE